MLNKELKVFKNKNQSSSSSFLKRLILGELVDEKFFQNMQKYQDFMEKVHRICARGYCSTTGAYNNFFIFEFYQKERFKQAIIDFGRRGRLNMTHFADRVIDINGKRVVKDRYGILREITEGECFEIWNCCDSYFHNIGLSEYPHR